MNNCLVEVQRLRHVYPDGTVALRELSLQVARGESVAIIGANGAGKSTLLLHLNGQLAPASGAVRIGEVNVGKRTLPEIRRRVGMLFQEPDDQLFMPTVYDDVAFGPVNLGFSGAELERRVNDALERVEARHLAKKAPYRLSGGEKRRVALATVLSMSPDILVLDEPTNGLDPHARRQLIALLGELKQTRIFASHDMDMVLELCERTVLLKDGEVKADGATREIFADEALLAECRVEKPLSMQGCPVCGGKERAESPVGAPRWGDGTTNPR